MDDGNAAMANVELVCREFYMLARQPEVYAKKYINKYNRETVLSRLYHESPEKLTVLVVTALIEQKAAVPKYLVEYLFLKERNQLPDGTFPILLAAGFKTYKDRLNLDGNIHEDSDAKSLLDCLTKPQFDVAKFDQIIVGNHFVPYCYHLNDVFDWDNFWSLLAKVALKDPKRICALTSNCGFPRDEVEMNLMKILLLDANNPESVFSDLNHNGLNLNAKLLSSVLIDSSLMEDTRIQQILLKHADPSILHNELCMALRVLFADGSVSCLKAAKTLVRAFAVSEEYVLSSLIATEDDRNEFLKLRKYQLPMKTYFGLKFNGIRNEFWRTMLQLYSADSEALQYCMHDVVVGGIIEENTIEKAKNMDVKLGSKIWTSSNFPKLDDVSETLSIESLRAMLKAGIRLNPKSIADVTYTVFESSPSKRFIYFMAEIEKYLWANSNMFEVWILEFENHVLQDDNWTSILGTFRPGTLVVEPELEFSDSGNFDSKSSPLNDEEKSSVEVQAGTPTTSTFASSMYNAYTNLSSAVTPSTGASITSSIIGAYSSVSNSVKTFARDQMFKDKRKFYYSIEKLVEMMEQEKSRLKYAQLAVSLPVTVDNIQTATKETEKERKDYETLIAQSILVKPNSEDQPSGNQRKKSVTFADPISVSKVISVHVEEEDILSELKKEFEGKNESTDFGESIAINSRPGNVNISGRRSSLSTGDGDKLAEIRARRISIQNKRASKIAGSKQSLESSPAEQTALNLSISDSNQEIILPDDIIEMRQVNQQPIAKYSELPFNMWLNEIIVNESAQGPPVLESLNPGSFISMLYPGSNQMAPVSSIQRQSPVKKKSSILNYFGV